MYDDFSLLYHFLKRFNFAHCCYDIQFFNKNTGFDAIFTGIQVQSLKKGFLCNTDRYYCDLSFSLSILKRKI